MPHLELIGLRGLHERIVLLIGRLGARGWKACMFCNKELKLPEPKALRVGQMPRHFAGEAVGVKGVLTGEQEELPREYRVATQIALLVAGHEAALGTQLLDVEPDEVSAMGGVVHLVLEVVDMPVVLLEGTTNLLLEVIDENEIGKERQDVLYLEQLTILEEGHGLLDILVFLDDVSCDAQPKLLAQFIILGLGSMNFC